MTKRLFISLISIFVAIGVWPQTSVEVSVPRTQLSGRRFTVNITVNNPDGNVSAPKAPTLEHCTFLGGPGVSSSTSVSVINGRMERAESKTYSYTYQADEAGNVKVPAMSVSVNGKTYSTQAKQFTITDSGQSGTSPQQSAGNRPSNGKTSADFQIGANDLFMTVGVSKPSVFEQQAVECSIKIYSSNMQVDGLSIQNIPSFDGCLVEVIGTPQTIDWHEEKVGGRQMYAAVVYRALLYPQRAGTITLSGGEYNVSAYRQVWVQDFFGYRPVTENKELKIKPKSVTLTVKALPEPKPAGFTGAVGSFKASSRLVGNSFKTNEASSIIYSIEGTGNIKFLPEPQIDFPSEFEVYDPSVDNSAHVSGHNMTGTETIEYTFVPQSVGKFKIGGFDFVYFDPSTASYKTIPIEGYDIDVKQGATVSGSGVVGKQDLKSKNTDIHHIRLNASKPTKAPSYLHKSALYWISYVILAVIFAAAIFMLIKSRGKDMASRRHIKAGRAARKRLATAGKLLSAKKYDDFYAEMLRAMNNYLSDKLRIPASQLNRDNIIAELNANNAPEKLDAQLLEILDACEIARYTPQNSSEDADKIYQQARNVIDSIEHLK